ncbi:MAG: UDP-N-acetylmuramoyl-tripeptide--D-alanyl-D-alanine ligase [Gammaproteobacteria bacterium]|nr:UDP-N-acetylmuramoyl-tripeptide--D-alanyl-D-alanine ligase [Gammaproteobacteria bacterium]
MISLQLSTIAKAIDAQLIGEDVTISQVFTDSRQKVADSLFIALVGENFDAHDFVQTAQQQGAKALLVSKEVDNALPQLLVENTEKALGDLAKLVRQRVNPKVIGITGSAGKTSVKEMTAEILKCAVGEQKVLATAGNFNNHIGVPLTLLNLTHDTEYAVIEMGANHIGEIAYCAAIAKPDVAVVNNVAPAHIEGFGSIEGVAKAKGEIYQSLAESGIGVINLDSDFAQDYIAMTDFQKVTVSRHENATFTAQSIKLDDNNCATFDMNIESQKISIELNTPGEHQVSNALVAAALTASLGIGLNHIKQGLEQAQSVKGRLNRFRGINGSQLIDDTYNASVASVNVAIDVLSHWQGTKILVLGDMAELGGSSKKYHQEVGAYAKQQAIDELMTWGSWSKYSSQAFGENAAHFESKDSLIDSLMSKANNDTQILVKGSRSARMEQVVEALKANDHANQDEHHNSLGGGNQC